MDPRYPNLKPWKPGQSGNPRGRKATSLTRLLRDAMAKAELCGQPTPGGKPVDEVFVEACIAHAIQGHATFAGQIWDRMEGRVPREPDDAGGVDAVIEVEFGKPPDQVPPAGLDGATGEFLGE